MLQEDDDHDVSGGHDCLDHQYVDLSSKTGAGHCGVCHEKEPVGALYVLIFTAYREDGSPIYSGCSYDYLGREFDSEEKAQKYLEYYTKGHPYVYSVKACITKIPQSRMQSAPVDRSESALRAWAEVYGR